MRTVMNVSLVAILGGVAGYLVYEELTPDEEGRNGIAPTEAQATHEVVREDPLLDLRYVKAERENNFKAFGLPDAMVKRTVERARRIEEMHEQKLRLLLQDAAEPVLLADALCGDSPTIRPRYAGVRFFVEQDASVRRPINLQRVSQLERQDWSVTSPIEEVYNTLELVEDRQEDATLMGVAAILLGREQDAMDRHKPWGRSLVTGAWSWKLVKKEAPQVEDYLVQYFALLHVAAEMAQADDGICSE